MSKTTTTPDGMRETKTSHILTDGTTLTLDELAELDAPFAAETAELFASVRDHDRPTLAARCDDDLGIIDINIDIDPSGGAEVIRDREGWETWFVQLDAMDATTDTLVTRDDAVDGETTGMGVVDVTQILTVGARTGLFHGIVTIVGKRVEGRWVEGRWVEARWHASRLDTELPEGFGQPSA